MPTIEEPLAVTEGAMRDCLVRLRDRAEKAGRARDVAEIDAVLSPDPEAEIRMLIGNANVTPRQRECAVEIHNFRSVNGYGPTMQELADTLGVSKVTVFEWIGALERKGVVTRDRHKARSLALARGK